MVKRDLKKQLFIMISLLLVSTVWVGYVRSTSSAGTPVIYVDPPSIIDTAKVAGSKLTININIKDVTNLYMFDFMLNYSTTILDLTTSQVGSLFPTDSFIWTNETQRTLGFVRFMVGLPLGSQVGVNGSGALMTMNFTVVSSGATRLDLSRGSETSEAMAWDCKGHAINVKVFDGYFRNTSGPKLYVNPQNVTDPALVQGQTLTINVSVSDLSGLHRSEFSLSYDPALLNATDVIEGGFLKSAGSTEFSFDMNRTSGDIRVNITLVDLTSAATGSGALVEITFNVVGLGDCLLYPYDTALFDPDLTTIEHAAVEGLFNNNPLVHDVAVIKVVLTVSETQIVQNVSVIISKPVSSIESGKHVNVTVTVRNNGTMLETADVTAYYDSTQIGKKSGTALSRGASTTLTFDWDTGGVATGNHTIWAEASQVAGETNTANNKFTMETNFLVSSSSWSVPTELIVAVAVVIIVILLVLAYFLRSRKRRSNVT